MKYVVLQTFLAAWLLVLMPIQADGVQTVRLNWDPSPNASVVGYNLYYGTESGYYLDMISAGNNLQADVAGLVEGMTYYFAVTSVDATGQESTNSNEVSYSVPGITPPGPIQSIVPDSSGQDLIVSWEPSPDPSVVGYDVSYGTNSGVYTDDVFVTGASEATIYNLQTGLTYYFVVRAFDAANSMSVESAEATYTLSGLNSPSPITSFQQVLPEEYVNISWTPISNPDVAGYIVHYGQDLGYYYNQVYVGNTNLASIYGLANGTTYYFYVTAYDSNGQESPPSSTASYTVPNLDPPAAIDSIQPFDQGVTLSWTPSQSPAAVGYVIYFGPYSGYYTDGIYVSGTNTATVTGLQNGLTYYFAVVTWDYTGQQSVPSVEVSCTLPAAVVAGPVLSLQPLNISGIPNAYALTSTDALPAAWEVDASTDLQTWHTLTSGIDPALNVAVVVSAKPQMFFRLNCQYPNYELQTQTADANGFPNSFVITTTDSVPGNWMIEGSEDLNNWETLANGADSHVNLAVVYAAPPGLFFRLKGQ